MLSTAELKRAILTLLKEDEEFRYAIAGLIGLEEIIKGLREMQKTLIDHSKAIESLQRAVAEQGKVIVEHAKTIESLQRTIADHGKTIESLQKAIANQGEAIRDLARIVAAIGRRYGVVTEEAFREAVKYSVEDLLRTYTVRR